MIKALEHCCRHIIDYNRYFYHYDLWMPDNASPLDYLLVLNTKNKDIPIFCLKRLSAIYVTNPHIYDSEVYQEIVFPITFPTYSDAYKEGSLEKRVADVMCARSTTFGKFFKGCYGDRVFYGREGCLFDDNGDILIVATCSSEGIETDTVLKPAIYIHKKVFTVKNELYNIISKKMFPYILNSMNIEVRISNPHMATVRPIGEEAYKMFDQGFPSSHIEMLVKSLE